MHCDGPILAKLLFSFVHLADEIDEPLPGLWHSLFWPIGELKLTNCSRLAVLEEDKCVCVFFFSFLFLITLIT